MIAIPVLYTSISTMALTLKQVRNFLYLVRLKWYDIGLELEIKIEDLDEIKAVNHNDPSKCLTEMIKVWLTLEPTWEALADALQAKAIKEIALSRKGKP